MLYRGGGVSERRWCLREGDVSERKELVHNKLIPIRLNGGSRWVVLRDAELQYRKSVKSGKEVSSPAPPAPPPPLLLPPVLQCPSLYTL